MLNDYLKEGRKQPLIPCNWSHVIKSAIGYIISHDSDKYKYVKIAILRVKNHIKK